MYTRSIHERKDLQKLMNFTVKMNEKYIPL